MNEVTTAWKMATAVVILSFVLSIVVSLMYITRAFWGRTENTVESAIINTYEAEAYQLASYGRPVPVASMWKVINSLTNSTATYKSGKLAQFTMTWKDKYGNTYTSNKYSDILTHLDEKGYMSYSEAAGTYNVDITITG